MLYIGTCCKLKPQHTLPGNQSLIIVGMRKGITKVNCQESAPAKSVDVWYFGSTKHIAPGQIDFFRMRVENTSVRFLNMR